MKIDKENMFIAFKLMGKTALTMDHYDLEAASSADYTAEEWKLFLMEPEIVEYVKKEMEIIRTSRVNKIVQDSSDSRSVAKAQLLTSLQKMEPDEKKAEGPTFIYCYVPLNNEQMYAPNVQEVDEDGRPVEAISKG